MNLCFLCKFPPIEGGVSASTFWLARGLAERGHEIHVVTNADEVEPAYRMRLESDDWEWYQGDFPSGGRLRVHNTESFSRHTMHHIPVANPFVSKVASLGTDVVRVYGCEAVFAYYFEPYGIAGGLVAQWTKRPLIIKHAGSDLDRLCGIPGLATAYKETVRSASAVMTRPYLMPRFLGMGVSSDRLIADIPLSVRTEVFHPQSPPLDVERLAIRSSTLAPSSFDPALPTIGIYGKVGPSKGTYDLLAALERLAREGLVFNLLAMVGGVQGEQVTEAAEAAGIVGRTYLLPYLPNWKVPRFIRACTAVCFLERDFPIAIHGPVIPREVLACGTCLVLSGEIAAKQQYRAELMTGENVLLVDNPKDHAALASVLRDVVTRPENARTIGQRGAEVTRRLEDYPACIRDWETLFRRFAPGGSPSPIRPASPALPTASDLDFLADPVRTLLAERCPDIVQRGLAEPSDGGPFAVLKRLCEQAEQYIRQGSGKNDLGLALAALRYQRARLEAAHDGPDGCGPPFPVNDQLQNRVVSEETVHHLRPVRGGSVRIERFDFDLTPLFTEPSTPAVPAALPPGPTLVLFQRSANLIPCELRIDDATRELIERCDGTRTTGEVVEDLCRYFGAEAPAQREEVTRKSIAALGILYKARVIVFGERVPGWGWTGGERRPVAASLHRP